MPQFGAYDLKILMAATGFTAGLAGMALERRWLVGVGIGLLGVAFLLRFAGGKRPAS